MPNSERTFRHSGAKMRHKMTDQKREAIRKAIRDQTAVNTANPKAARAALVRMGLYTKDGKVAAEYSNLKRGHATRK